MASARGLLIGMFDSLSHGLSDLFFTLGESRSPILGRSHLLHESSAACVRVEAAFACSGVLLDVFALRARVVIVVVGLKVGHVDAEPPHRLEPDMLCSGPGERRILSKARSRPLRAFAHGSWSLRDLAHGLGLPSLAL